MPNQTMNPTRSPTVSPTQTEPHQTNTRNGFNLGTDDDHNQSQREQFTEFFQSFLSEQSHDLAALRAAASNTPDQSALHRLISHVVSHYERYYETKAVTAQRDVNPMFSPSWTSTTENVFMWVGGWRPSAAFHLLHSKSGIQLEARIEEIIRGGIIKDLGDVSAAQLEALDRLQRETVRSERMTSEEAAEAQEAMAATEMLQIVSSEDQTQMEPKMNALKERMRTVLTRADQLRIDTIKGIVDRLEPIQAMHFLIAAAELHLTVHEYGKDKDRLVAQGQGAA